MRPRATYPTKHCIHCGAQILPRYAEGSLRFSRRQYCNHKCQHAHRPPGGGVRRSEQREPMRAWGSAKLTELEVITMRQLRWIGRLKYSVLCQMFGRSHKAIWAACNGETWAHLPMPKGKAKRPSEPSIGAVEARSGLYIYSRPTMKRQSEDGSVVLHA